MPILMSMSILIADTVMVIVTVILILLIANSSPIIEIFLLFVPVLYFIRLTTCQESALGREAKNSDKFKEGTAMLL
jgi:hypothetical protein